MLKKLKIILSKGYQISPQFYKKLQDDTTISKVLKGKITAFYNKKPNSREILFRSINKKIGGTVIKIEGVGEYDDNYDLGMGSYAIAYRLTSSPDLVIKIFKPQRKKITIESIISNIHEFEKYIYNKYDYIKDKTTFVPVDPNIIVSNDKYFYLSKYCDGNLYDILQTQQTELYENFNKTFEVLKTIYINKIPFVHGDIKFENILYKQNEIYLHDLDGIFVYDPNTLLNVTDNPYSRHEFVTPFATCPFYIWYRVILGFDDIENTKNLYNEINADKKNCEKIWNILFYRQTQAVRDQARDEVKSIYGMTFKEYIEQSVLKIGDNDIKFRKWVIQNLAICDLYSYYMSIDYYLGKYNIPVLTELKNQVLNFMRNEIINILNITGGRRKNMKGSGTNNSNNQANREPLKKSWSINTSVFIPMDKLIVEFGNETDANGKKVRTFTISDIDGNNSIKYIMRKDGRFEDINGNIIDFDDNGNMIYVNKNS
jgi:hypothetical protein